MKSEKRLYMKAVGSIQELIASGEYRPGSRLPPERELAEQFVEEGLYGNIPESLQFYIDYEAIARDLSVEYSETVIAGSSVIYRCG